MSTTARIPDAIARLKGVFLEIPGTQLSMIDASRLSGLDRQTWWARDGGAQGCQVSRAVAERSLRFAAPPTPDPNPKNRYTRNVKTARSVDS